MIASNKAAGPLKKYANFIESIFLHDSIDNMPPVASEAMRRYDK